MPARSVLKLLVVMLISACASPVEVTTPTTATTLPTTTTALVTTTTSPAATTTTTSNLIDTGSFRAPFVLDRPSDAWRVTNRAGDFAIEITTPSSDILIFTVVGADSVEAWLEKLTTDSALVATEPTATEIGSLAALTLDVRLAEGVASVPQCGEPCVQLFDHRPTPDLAYGWAIVADMPNRVWLIDNDGTPVAIFAETTEARFQTWVAEVEAALATLTWVE